MNNLICPYTARPIADIDRSREHVIPDALGGANAFALVADRQCNSSFGSGIDARLISDPFVVISAALARIVTRSGPVGLRTGGKLENDGSPLDVSLGNASAEFRFRIPVVKDSVSGDIVGVRGFGADAAKAELDRLTQNLQRKGKSVTVGGRLATPAEINITLTHNANAVTQGLGKIAYLSSVIAYGDEFVLSKAGQKYRHWVSADPTWDSLKKAGIAVSIPPPGDELPSNPEEHVVVCQRDGDFVISTVRLFGSDLLTRSFVVRFASKRQGNVFVVNAREKTFQEHDLDSLR